MTIIIIIVHESLNNRDTLRLCIPEHMVFPMTLFISNFLDSEHTQCFSNFFTVLLDKKKFMTEIR